MTVQAATIRLTPQGFDGARPLPTTVGNVLTHIERLAKQTTRMAFLGRSAIKGRQPSWLTKASDIRFLDYDTDGGDRVLSFDAPLLGDAAHVLYSQIELWPTRPDPGQTVFDLLSDVVTDVNKDNTNSELYDSALLSQLASFGRLCEKPYSEVSVVGLRRRAAMQPPRFVGSTKSLQKETPKPTRALIAGRLDMIQHSDQNFAFVLDDGQRVKGVLSEGAIMDYAPLFSRRVLVAGSAVFRPSGAILRVEADRITEGEDAPSFWSRMPTPVPDTYDVVLLQSKTAALRAAITLDPWPGDETDDELLKALEAVE